MGRTYGLARSLALREERRRRVFENRVLRRIFRPERGANREWRKLHDEEFHSLYHLPNIVKAIRSRRLRLAGHLVRMEKGRSAFKILTGTPTGNRSLGRSMRRWENNIRMDLEKNTYQYEELG